jgi:hypothetical protein
MSGLESWRIIVVASRAASEETASEGGGADQSHGVLYAEELDCEKDEQGGHRVARIPSPDIEMRQARGEEKARKEGNRVQVMQDTAVVEERKSRPE